MRIEKAGLKIDMYNKLLFLFLFVVCFLPFNVCAETNTRVGFFPFNIYANKDIKLLKKKIPMMLADEIKKAGAQSV
ncbi:MAG: hypothetical protein GY707_14165, partial [Desulfobacteraceae bacterium]|nr:hypothetical protein [Desulfobacteraceae bacterium]